jgi:glycosyltransferase involved in cell wall biosynthesis
MAAIIARARATAGDAVSFHEPVPRTELVRELADARLMVYRGDPGETFCQAAAEAQAMGVPLVTQPIGSLPERVEHGRTGFVESAPADFADACVRLLTDDALWRQQHLAALESDRWSGWDLAATRFARLAVTGEHC